MFKGMELKKSTASSSTLSSMSSLPSLPLSSSLSLMQSSSTTSSSSKKTPSPSPMSNTQPVAKTQSLGTGTIIADNVTFKPCPSVVVRLNMSMLNFHDSSSSDSSCISDHSSLCNCVEEENIGNGYFLSECPSYTEPEESLWIGTF